MSFWFWHGLRRGIQSTRYPGEAETAPGVSPGRPIDTEFVSFPHQAPDFSFTFDCFNCNRINLSDNRGR